MTELAIRGPADHEHCRGCDAEVTGSGEAVQRLLCEPDFRRWLDRSCATQNVPTLIADPGTLARVAALLR